MPSMSYRKWRIERKQTLDEIEQILRAVRGIRGNRRAASEQVHRAYTVLLASQFQGFCRDLHTESVDHVLSVLAPPAALLPLVRAEFTRERRLDRGNARSEGLKADFSRLGDECWTMLEVHDPNRKYRGLVDQMIDWRNAIVHQDFAKLRGVATLKIGQVRRWRIACQRLARSFDAVMHDHLRDLTGSSPW